MDEGCYQITDSILLAPLHFSPRPRIEIRWLNRLVSDFIRRAKDFEKAGHSDLALDIIYDEIDDLLRARRFALCTSILDGTDTAQCSADILLALLTATLPAKSELPTRLLFFQRVERELGQRHECEEGLLDGLA